METREPGEHASGNPASESPAAFALNQSAERRYYEQVARSPKDERLFAEKVISLLDEVEQLQRQLEEEGGEHTAAYVRLRDEFEAACEAEKEMRRQRNAERKYAAQIRQALEEADSAMMNAAATLRGIQSDVEHHTLLTPEITALEDARTIARAAL